MNEKLRTILRTAWNEPRHFFFWLVIITGTALAILLLAASSGVQFEDAAWLSVVALLGFCAAGSSIMFLLALIPAVRRFLSLVLKRRLLALAALCTLVGLFYAVENWRGWRAWQNSKRQAEVRGERLDLAAIVPPPVPMDQNFFSTPLWTDMEFDRKPGEERVVWKDTNWGNRAVFSISGPNSGAGPDLGNWRAAKRMDLEAWQAFYRGSNNVFKSGDGSATNYFPVSPQPREPAADVLLALSRFEDNRRLLLDSAHRPHARFWVNYDAGFAAVLPHLARIKNGGQYLCLHAEAARKAGDKQTALEDFRLSMRLIEAVRTEPIIVSHLVRIAMLSTALQPVWEGVNDGAWSAAELKLVDDELRKLDFFEDYQVAMAGERGFNIWLLDYLRNQRLQSVSEALAILASTSDPPVDTKIQLLSAMIRVAPRGWFDQNKVTVCRTAERYLSLADQESRTVNPIRATEFQQTLENTPVRPYNAFGRYLSNLAKVSRNFAQAQTMADLTRVACAVERYRLANNRMPESLSLLVPNYLDTLPHDVITGGPLKYEHDENGGYLIYSVGWNQADDHGKAGTPEKKGDWNPRDGDWVWHTPRT